MSIAQRATRLRLRLLQRLEQAGYGVKRPEPAEIDAARYATYDRSALTGRRFINIGAGSFRHPYWTNVDYLSDWYANQQADGFVGYDLTALAPLPFEAGSLQLAYSSHTIEHVGSAATANLLSECHRVLTPCGGVRITCPDAALLYRSVAGGHRSYWRWREPWFLGPLSTARSLAEVTLWDFLVREIATPRCRFYVHCKDPLQPAQVQAWFHALSPPAFLDRLVEGLAFDGQRPGDHIAWWNEDKLIAMMRQAGFKTVYASRRNQSLFAPLTHPALFDRTQPHNSLYVEAMR